MDDHRNLGSSRQLPAEAPQPNSVAQQSATAIVQSITDSLDPAVLSKLHEAVLDADPETAKQVIHNLLSEGVRAVDLADHYIPAVSRE